MFNSEYCDKNGCYILTDETSDKAEQVFNVTCSLSPFTEGKEEKIYRKLCTFFDSNGVIDTIYIDMVRAYAFMLANDMRPNDCTLEWSDTFPYRLAYYKKDEN